MAAKSKKGSASQIKKNPSPVSSVGVSTSHKSSNQRSNSTRELNNEKTSWFRLLSMRNLSFLILAILFGILQCYHVSTMFEHDRYFSHLSDLEREMTFRTEMGFYFSYYKEMVTARSIREGVKAAMYDEIVEYPRTVNALKRFNIYPEIFLGIAKRGFESFMSSINQTTKQCYTVKRGRGLSNVLNCEGLGDIAIFYVSSIFLWNGVMMSAFFALGTVMSGSLFGGILAVTTFFYNHGECTRVQWTPPLRESFGYPFFIIQLLAVTYTLRSSKPRWLHSVAIMLPSMCFILCWQFAQFTLLTQILSVFATFILGYIGPAKLRCILQGQSVALFLSYLLLFGNEMLLTSYYPACLLTLWVILFLQPVFQTRVSGFWILCVIQSVILAAGIIGFKILISTLLHVKDDAHISNLLKSKFTSYRDFHTLLYICSKEFDFMETEAISELTFSLLLPSALGAFAMVIYFLVQQELRLRSDKPSGGGDASLRLLSADNPKDGAVFVYHMFQLMAFSVMAVLIMRLKLFFTPQLCLMTSLLASRKIFSFIKEPLTHRALIVALLALMTVTGVANIEEQRSHVGDFSNGDLETTLEWINANTPPNAVFAGAMTTMSAVKLSTRRPIVNHPHYEDANLRERTKKVYTIYSRKPAKEVHEILTDLHVQYVVMEVGWCLKRYAPGCSLPEVWDVEDPGNRDAEPLCKRLQRYAGPYFKAVFKNKAYTILRLADVTKRENSQRIQVSISE